MDVVRTWGRDPYAVRRPVRLTRRGRTLVYVVVFTAAAAVGACDPLWRAVPWSVYP